MAFIRSSRCGISVFGQIMRPATALIIALFFVCALPAARGHAAQSQPQPMAKMALLDGGRDGEIYRAGVEITLSGQTKTYWRMPGDSGLPPVFDWSKSDNVARVEVEWPRPERIADPSGTILGYHNRVIFPLRVTPKEASKPVTLRLALDFAICEDLCVPTSAQSEVKLDAGTEREAINAFRALVPRQGILGQSPDPRLVAIAPDPARADALLVTTGAPVDDLILEGPLGWYFGDATRVGGTDTAPIFRVLAVEKPTNARFAGLALTLTLLGPKTATETAPTLDADGAIR